MSNSRPNTFLSLTILTFFLIVKQTLSQMTFYYEDQNIRFYQVTLIPANGSVIRSNQTAVTFTKSTDFIENVTNTELALCGFSLQNQMNMEYTATIKYSVGLFTITIQAYNQTIFQYVSFYAIMYKTQAKTYFQSRSLCQQCQILNQNPNKNRTQQLNLTMVTNRTSGNNFYVRPFIRSMKTRQGGNGYTRLQLTFSYWDMYSTKVALLASTYESIVTEVCVTVVALSYAVIGSNYTYVILEQTIRQFSAASIKGIPTNFGLSSTVYGPIFNKKCLIGFQYIYFRDGIKQIYFDATKTGIQSLTQNTPQYFYAEMSIFCVTRLKSCSYNQGIQTGIQQCVNCSVMIKNCAYCLTESECTQCVSGYYIDKAKKCCPTYLANCSICSLANTCTQCVDGYYTAEAGTCSTCSSAVSNCYRCANSSFCYQCKDGYTLSNYTTCVASSSTNTNSTGKGTDNSTNNNTNNNNETTSQSGISTWMILFIAVAGAFALMILILIIICIKLKKDKSSDNNALIVTGEPPTDNNQSPNKRNLEDDNLNENNTPSENQGTHQVPTSMDNNKFTDINVKTVSQDMINQSQLKPGSGMQIRYGSNFQSNFTNLINPKQKTFAKNQSVNKDKNSINSGKQKSTTHNYPDSLISSGMQKSNDIDKMNQNNDMKLGLQSDRPFKKKDSSFLPQISKNTIKFRGSIHLKANYYK